MKIGPVREKLQQDSGAVVTKGGRRLQEIDVSFGDP